MKPFNTVEDLVTDPSFRRWILHKDPEARDQWRAYLAVYPENKALVEKAKSVLEELPRVKYQMSAQELATLWQQIEKKSEPPKVERPIVASKFRKFQWFAVAATITVILLLTGAMIWYIHTPIIDTTFHTEYGETQHLTLPDGSLVTLNANSTLHYHEEKYVSSERHVWMEGEAFFEVKKLTTSDGKAAKFIVRTDDLEVEVLGTQFNVNTRRTSTKVVLTEGKVRLNLTQTNGGEPVTMIPGEMVTYTPEKKAVKKENVNLNVYTAWKKQELVFEDTPVREIIDLLEDNYGIKIRLQNKVVGNRHYTGTFKNPDPDIILTVITAVLQLEIERHENVIILK